MSDEKYDSRRDTIEHICTVQKYLNMCLIILTHKIDQHDKTKLVEPEKSIFDEFTPKLKTSTYGSDEYNQFLKEMKVALDHHYEHNRHHPEYFDDGIIGMNLLDLVEMLCDWVAATKRHDDGDIVNSIEYNQKRFGYSDELKQILLNTVEMLQT